MNAGGTFVAVVLAASMVSTVTQAADLLTIEQAETLSKATGRPILAMAGSKT